MSEETFENNLKEKVKPPSGLKATHKELGCKVDEFSAGDIETDYELDPESILGRWKKIFSAVIQKYDVREEALHQMAKKFSEEIEKMVRWLKSQPHSEQYEITHFINPYSGEHITIHKPHQTKRVYGVFARFESQGIKLDVSFLKE